MNVVDGLCICCFMILIFLEDSVVGLFYGWLVLMVVDLCIGVYGE